MNGRRQVHNSYDTKFRVQGAMKVDMLDPAEEARKAKELLREADSIAHLATANLVDTTPEMVQLYAAQVTALATLATAHLAAAQYYWEDR